MPTCHPPDTEADLSTGWESVVIDALHQLVSVLPTRNTHADRARITVLEEIIDLAATPDLSPRRQQACCCLGLHWLEDAVPESAHALLKAAQDLVQSAQPLDFVARPVHLSEPLKDLLLQRQSLHPVDRHQPRQDLFHAILNQANPALRDALLVLTSEGPSPPLATWFSHPRTSPENRSGTPTASPSPHKTPQPMPSVHLSSPRQQMELSLSALSTRRADLRRKSEIIDPLEARRARLMTSESPNARKSIGSPAQNPLPQFRNSAIPRSGV